MHWRVRTGLVTGRAHLLDERNCQDALAVLQVEHAGARYIIGAVADGCGSSPHTEVGAWLAVEFVTRAIRRLLYEGHTVETLPAALYQRIRRFLQQILESLDIAEENERIEFVRDCLLFTVLGFVIGPERSIVFVAGDGVVRINDELWICDQNGAPEFVGYHLLEDWLKQAGVSLSDSFIVRDIATDRLNRLAIGSDGWREMADALDEVWESKGKAGVQLLMNRWSDARRFQDDAALIVVERVEEAEENGEQSSLY